MCMPLPPPPKAAFTINGYPIRSACLRAARRSTGCAVPGTIGIPLASAARRAAALSPMISIASGVGPMNVRPASTTAAAKLPRSARKPYPGWTIVAFERRAASRIASIDR